MYVKNKRPSATGVPRKRTPIRDFLGSALGLVCLGVASVIALWQTGYIIFFWVGFVGIVGGLLKWRFSYASSGNTETEHQVYRRWW